MAVDQKYPSVSVDTGDRTPIGDDEPVFVLRARDAMAIPVLDAYAQLCSAHGSPSEHLQSVLQTHNAFRDWQDAHPGDVKQPD